MIAEPLPIWGQVSRLFSSAAFRLGFGVAISALSLFLALRNVDLQEVKSALLQADKGFVGLAVSFVVVQNVVKGIRWRDLLGEKGQQVSLAVLIKSVFVAQMFNAIYPARVGDLSRIWIVGGMGPGRSFTLGTILIEKFLDSLAYTLLFVFLLASIPLPGWITNSVLGFLVIVFITTGLVAFLAMRPAWLVHLGKQIIHRFPFLAQTSAYPRLQALYSSLAGLQSRSKLVRLGAWTAVIWAIAVSINQIVLLALGIHLSWAASVLILVLLQIGISVPSIPGRIGLVEYVCVLGLGILGIDRSLAFTYGIILNIVIFAPIILLGLLFFWGFGIGERGADHQAN